MRDKKTFLFWALISAAVCSGCFAQGFSPFPEFTSSDKVLILAPHPDDEAIGVAGVIQRAREKGAAVRVACFTNGDHNELAFIAYEKRIVFRKGAFIHFGQLRRKETLEAMKFLGLDAKDVLFMGYPDFGTMEILTRYWGKTKPFRYLLTRISQVPYPECVSPGAPYVGESILNDLKKVISGFEPTKIFVSHPVDSNRDHRSLYLFLRVALWDLADKMKEPQVYPYLIHVVGWPLPRGFHPELRLVPPLKLKDADINWEVLELSESEVAKKNQSITFYKSQIACNPPYLFTFARRSEMFGDYPAIKLKMSEGNDFQWNADDLTGDSGSIFASKLVISKVSYAQTSKDLLIKIDLRRKRNKNFGLSVFLLGYSKTNDFALMPKINLRIGVRGLQIKEKRQVLFVKNAWLSYQGNSLLLKIPLSLLGYPDYMLAAAYTKIKDLSLDDTAWRIVEFSA